MTEALCVVKAHIKYDVHFREQVAKYGNHILMIISTTHLRKKILFEI